MQQESYAAIVRFESSSEDEYKQFLELATEVGGVIVAELTIVHGANEEIPEAYSINKNNFRELVEKQGHAPAWVTRYWNAMVSMHQEEQFPELKHNDRPPITDVDLRLVRARLEQTEQGSKYMPSNIGPNGWNILVGVINERFADNPDVVPLLPWDREIHPRLGRARNRQQVIGELAAKYTLSERQQSFRV